MTGFLSGVPRLFWAAPAGGVLALVAAAAFYRSHCRGEEASPEMRRAGDACRESALRELLELQRREFLMLTLTFLLVVVLWLADYLWRITLATLWFGAASASIVGLFHMFIALWAPDRIMVAARQGPRAATLSSVRAGAAIGLSLTGCALLEISAWFILIWGGTRTGWIGYGNSLDNISQCFLNVLLGSQVHALFAGTAGEWRERARVTVGGGGKTPEAVAVRCLREIWGWSADFYSLMLIGVIGAMAMGAFCFPNSVPQGRHAFIMPLVTAAGVVPAMLFGFWVVLKAGERFSLSRGYARTGAYMVALFMVAAGMQINDYMSAWLAGRGAQLGLLLFLFWRVVPHIRLPAHAGRIFLDLVSLAGAAMLVILMYSPLVNLAFFAPLPELYGLAVVVAGSVAVIGLEFAFASASTLLGAAAALCPAGSDDAAARDGVTRADADLNRGRSIAPDLPRAFSPALLVVLLLLFVRELGCGNSTMALQLLKVEPSRIPSLLGLALPLAFALTGLFVTLRAAALRRPSFSEQIALYAPPVIILLSLGIVRPLKIGHTLYFLKTAALCSFFITLALPNLIWLWRHIGRLIARYAFRDQAGEHALHLTPLRDAAVPFMDLALRLFVGVLIFYTNWNFQL